MSGNNGGRVSETQTELPVLTIKHFRHGHYRDFKQGNDNLTTSVGLVFKNNVDLDVIHQTDSLF